MSAQKRRENRYYGTITLANVKRIKKMIYKFTKNAIYTERENSGYQGNRYPALGRPQQEGAKQPKESCRNQLSSLNFATATVHISLRRLEARHRHVVHTTAIHW